MTPFTSCTWPGAAVPSVALGGAAIDVAGGAGGLGVVSMPRAFGIAGTRGKENNSLIGGNTGAAPGDVPFSPSTKYGVEPGIMGTLPGDWGTALRSAPPGGAVGGDEGAAAMPGKENNSFPLGSFGATAIGGITGSVGSPGIAPGAGDVGTVPGAPGTKAVEPANDAAMARRSVSVSGPGWVY